MKRKNPIWGISIIIVFTLITALLIASCGRRGSSSGSDATDTGSKGKVQVVATIFPLYDWAREVIGEHSDSVELTLLIGDGVDLHSYQASVSDTALISTCDILIYPGGESDGWIEEIIEGSADGRPHAINLIDVLGDSAKEEEIVEGMQETDHHHDHDHGHEGHDHEGHEHEAHDHVNESHAHEDHHHEDHDHEGHEHHHGDGIEYDEHVWLSLRNAGRFVSAIEKALCEADPGNAEDYSRNAADYRARLSDLDLRYVDAVENSTHGTVLFGDRFPFRYLVDDYGIDYYAAFAGCSAETEASFETVVFLSGKVDELGLGNVLVIDGSDGKIAKTIVSNTIGKDQGILMLDSMQSTRRSDINGGATYLSIMESNLKVLSEALD